jgi:hypothetical protein
MTVTLLSCGFPDLSFAFNKTSSKIDEKKDREYIRKIHSQIFAYLAAVQVIMEATCTLMKSPAYDAMLIGARKNKIGERITKSQLCNLKRKEHN